MSDAYTRTREDLAVCETNGRSERDEDTFGNGNDVLHILGFDEAEKLVAAHTRERIFGTDATLDSAGELDEHEIPDAVPQAVVDDFEAVEIEEEDGETVSITVVDPIEAALCTRSVRNARFRSPVSSSWKARYSSAAFAASVTRARVASSSAAFRSVTSRCTETQCVKYPVSSGDGNDTQFDPERRPVFAVIEKLDFDRFPRV